MATISENITRINQAKVDIKNAIIAKGGTVAAADKIDTYAQAIEALSSEGDDETVKGIIDKSITKCNIPQGTTRIGQYTFSYCSSLTSVTIPDSVTHIGQSAFIGCTSLTSVTIPDSVTGIGNNAFSYCSGLTDIVIPDGVTIINYGVFRECSGLTSVTIPDSVTSIGGDAFNGCSNLATITVKATTPPTLGNNVIPSNVTAIYVPSGSVNAYKSASKWSNYASKIQAIQE